MNDNKMIAAELTKSWINYLATEPTIKPQSVNPDAVFTVYKDFLNKLDND
ncbi:hypothetical protein [Fructilactobacillus fructivorans]|nr:hypothetical protein [Fructilactobacillus fructivorans]